MCRCFLIVVKHPKVALEVGESLLHMKEYIADQKTGKALYKRTKKLYKRYKYGMLVQGLLLFQEAAKS